MPKNRDWLLEERAEVLGRGLHWYQWESSQDQRVKVSHLNLQGVLMNWGDPPDPEALIGRIGGYRHHAGEADDCRCLALPLVSLGHVLWPARVHIGGVIRIMSRKEFARLWDAPGPAVRRKAFGSTRELLRPWINLFWRK